MEKKLHSLLWKIDSAEISFEARRNSQVSIESGVRRELSYEMGALFCKRVVLLKPGCVNILDFVLR